MTEVHPEGNPHSSHYPEILPRSFNLIVKSSDVKKETKNFIIQKLRDIRTFEIYHKRNDEYFVFEFLF